jgi:outer membrane protein OmpA-like peptidoglycan-associated protein
MQLLEKANWIRKWFYRAIAVITVSLFAAPLAAQEPEPPEHPQGTAFAVDLFEPAPGPRNYFSVEGPEIGDDMKPFVGIELSYHHKPLVIYGCSDNGQCGDERGVINLVENLMVVDVLGSFNFLKRFQVGLALPVIVWQRGEGYDVVTEAAAGGGYDERLVKREDSRASSYGTIGDIRLHLKVRIIGDELKNGFQLAAAVIPTLPMSSWTGQGDGYSGSGFLTVTAPRVIAGFRANALRLALNIGVLWREKAELFSAQTGHSLTYGFGIGYSIVPAVEVLAEIYGQKSLVSESFTDMESAPLLFIGGARFRAKQFLFNVGGGGGILSGVGVPQFQIVAGGAWAPEAEKKVEEESFATEWDVDGDGIDNEVDKCPNEPEDLDSFEDQDGCPDTDNDKDGIPDGYDSCPNEPEDKDGYRDDDGCPDLDHDEDGIKGDADKCPDKAEDFDGFEDGDGCPDEDNDKDGIPDASDNCPDQAEDKDGFQDDDGCPDLDNDSDGVPDAQDKCPNKPETLNGYKDEDGCPDVGKTLVVVTETQIEIKEMVQFETDSDKITGDKSFEILNIVAMVLKGNTAVRVSIEGHTDSKGNADRNRELSKRRAESVKSYLVGKGVVADRLETVGWGPDKPIASNKTKRGRTVNRRVEFMIIQPEKIAPPPTETPEAGAAPTTQPEAGGSMDFTAGDTPKDESMDFTIEDKPKPAEPPPTAEESMDFTAGDAP